MRERRRRRAADAPARAGGRRLFQRVARGAHPAAQKQHRRVPVGGGQLKAPHRGLVGVLHFGNDSGKAAVAQAILRERKRHHLVPAFAIEQFVGRKPGLLEPGRVKIEPGQRPGDAGIRIGGKPGRCPCHEQGRGSVVAQRRRGGRDFVQATTVKAATAEPGIDRLNPERQQLRVACDRHGNTRLELGEQNCPIGLGKGGNGLHRGITTRTFPLCSAGDGFSSSHQFGVYLKSRLVASSRSPPTHRSKAAPIEGPAPAASNSVSDERSFIASTSPNTETASLVGRSCNAATHLR